MADAVLSYTTPKRDRPTVTVTFELDGEKFIARKPKDSILVYLAAASSDNASTADRLYAAMQFINGCLTPAGQQRIQSRLRDFDDDLEIDDLIGLMEDLGEAFKRADPQVAEKLGGQPAPRKRAARKERPPAGMDNGNVIDGDVVEITPAAAPNRAARRAKTTDKSAPAKTGRRLPR